jgi:hypothetical protein
MIFLKMKYTYYTYFLYVEVDTQFTEQIVNSQNHYPNTVQVFSRDTFKIKHVKESSVFGK